MKYRMLLIAGIKRHRDALMGVFLLTLLVSISLGVVLTIWTNSENYVNSELKRTGFGELTAWVSDVPDIDTLVRDLKELQDVVRVEAQSLIFSNYTVNKQDSDSEGQLILFAPEENPYRFFTDNLAGYFPEAPVILPGEVYVSPSLVSLFDVKIGDKIEFATARNGGTIELTVTGFYEDPLMGSSLIGMKGFLVCEEDYKAVVQTITSSGIDALARSGAMLHIFRTVGSKTTSAGLNRIINEKTNLSVYSEFTHSADAISGFMLILQKAFTGLLIAFVWILLLVVFVVLGHSITDTVNADYVNMGILKTTGFTSTELRRIQVLQYSSAILPGMLFGLVLTEPISTLASYAMVTTTGIRIPVNVPWNLGILAFAAILLLLGGYIVVKTEKIGHITPIKAIGWEAEEAVFRPGKSPYISGSYLNFSLAVRQLISRKRNYISACIVAALLVFFVSAIGRIDIWLGADGKGMMDAFNPADHDIGVQMLGRHTDEEARKILLSYTDIADTYLLAMPGVAVNGIDFTANVISEPDRFHILAGRTCTAADEIVVTEFVAADFGISIGDELEVKGDKGSGKFIVSGIYSCANDMGGNVGLSREGYLRIGQDNPQIWCHHYFLANPEQKSAAMNALTAAFGGDAHIHENTWPGLKGIISAMQVLVLFQYGMAAFFVLIVTVMTGSKILAAEQRDIGICKAIGFTDRQLRLSFALRFGIAAALGSGVGVVLAAVFTDTLVSAVMKLAGISNFTSSPGIAALVPALVVTLLFSGFAYLVAGKIKRADLTALAAE